MTRSIPRSLAGVLEDLELEQPTLVTMAQLTLLVERHELRTPARVVAARLRDRGWLLATDRQGVWEFAPAAVAGPHSRSDPLTPIRALLADNPSARCALTFQSAAWVHGMADRAPSRIEIAAATPAVARQLPRTARVSNFEPRLDYDRRRDVNVLAPESVLVHMAVKPTAVRSWDSAREWLPDLVAEVSWEQLTIELSGRAATSRARLGYLVQAMRPDIAAELRGLSPIRSKTWFGPRAPLRRHDNTWQVADTLLSFDPRSLEDVR